ncbi:MAG: serine/threonine-protein kinase [Thermoanaerobaculia bacterium]
MSDLRPTQLFPARSRGSSPIRIFVPGTDARTRYEIRSVLGSSGSTVVYAAFDRQRGEEVALKIFRMSGMSDTALLRLEREVAQVHDAGNPRLVRVFAIERAGDAVTVSMERVSGCSLKSRLGAGRLSLDEAIRISVETLEALKGMHELGLVHRDVKPGNILIDEHEAVRLTDFGLARRWEQGEGRSAEGEGYSGTIAYLAPEQAMGSHVDSRSDLYSFGVVLYEMLTGEVPLREASSIGTVLAHVKRNAPDVRSVRPETPVWLARMVAGLLAKDPSHRYPSADAVLDDLRARRMRLRKPWHIPSSLIRAGVIGASLLLAASAWHYFSSPRFKRIVVDSRVGARAVDADGRVLWVQPDLTRVEYADILQGTGQASQKVAAFLAGGHDTEPDFTHTLVLLDAETGRVERGVFLPDPSGSFPGFSNTFAVSGMKAVDLHGNGHQQLIITYAHIPRGPGYSIVYDPRTEEARVLFVSTGPQRFIGTADLAGDGTLALLFAGSNPALGNAMGIAALRIPVRRSRDPNRPESPWGATPDRDASDGGPTGLMWYALEPAGDGGLPGSITVDAQRRVISLDRGERGVMLLDFEGFFRMERHELPLAERSAARERTYERLRQARLEMRAGAHEQALRETEAALLEAERAGDRALLEWASRLRGTALLAAGERVEGERLLSALAQRPELTAAVALDAGRIEHLRGELDRAIVWYRRAVRERSPSSGFDGSEREEALEGLVLALGEKGRWEEASEEVAHFALVVPGRSAARRALRDYIDWRTGTARVQNVLPELDGSEPDLHRAWRLELRAARGERPEALAGDLVREYARSSSTRGLLLSLHGELFERRGRRQEAIAFSRRAYGVVAGDRGSQLGARAQFGVVAGRYAELLRRSARWREANAIEREARRHSRVE